jgi:hypothetical protein
MRRISSVIAPCSPSSIWKWKMPATPAAMVTLRTLIAAHSRLSRRLAREAPERRSYEISAYF